MNKLNFYHRGSNGDIIYSLPTIISYNVRANLFLRDERHLILLRSLLMRQSCITDVCLRWLGKHDKLLGEEFIDLSKFQAEALANTDQHLVLSHLKPQNKEFDLSLPWLENVEAKHVADIIVNRSIKYRDPKGKLDWHLLRPIADKCKFIGLGIEKTMFRKEVDIDYFPTQNALEMAQVIKGSKLFIGNQSLAFAIAESMKHPRCLEVYYKYNNCQPHGLHGHTTLTKELLEKYLDGH